jgi:hypothetical protein
MPLWRELSNVRLQIFVVFVDGRLAEITMEMPEDSGNCFDPPNPGELPYQRDRRLAICRSYAHLLESLTNTLGQATTVAQGWNPNPIHPIFALRWENDTSIAEFQNHSCGPNGSDQGRSKEIAELLEGQYCEKDDTLSYRQSEILYLDKELHR